MFQNSITAFRIGNRVELHPGCDLWMRGARYGNVTRIGRTRVHVRLDRLPKRTVPFCPSRLTVI